MSLTRQIAHNTIIQFSGKILGTVLAMVTLSLTMRYLGQTGFGEYSTAVNFLSVFAILIDLGLYLIVTREISKPGADEKKLLSNTITMRLAIGLPVLALAPLVALFLPYSNLTRLAILVNAAAFLFMSLNQILTGLFQKYLRMERVSVAEITGRVFWLVTVVLTLKLNLGLLWVVGFNSLSALLNFLLLYFFALKYAKIKLAFDFTLWRQIWRAAAPLALNVVLNLVYFKAGVIILTVMKPAEDVGILGAAQKILENLITFSAIFAGLLFPLFSKYLRADRPRFKRVFERGFDALAILVIPLIVGTLFLGKEMIVFFGGAEFAAASGVLKIMMFAVGTVFFGNLFGNVLVAADLQKKLVPVYIANAVLALVVSFIFIPRFSYYGAAFATLITEIVMCFVPGFFVAKYLKIRPSFKAFWKVLAATLAMALCLCFLPRNFNLAFLILIPGAVYFLILYLLKGVSKEVIQEIVSLKKESVK